MDRYCPAIDKLVCDKFNLHLPEEMKVEFVPGKDPFGIDCCDIFLNGEPYGDTITDQSYSLRNYIYHDCFHFVFYCELGWSPVLRTLYGVQRTPAHHRQLGNVEDRGRTRIIEEAIIFTIDAERSELGYQDYEISDNLWQFIQYHLSELQPGKFSREEWNVAIKKGLRLFEYLVGNRGGEVEFSNSEGKISFGTLELQRGEF